ncbi:MAG TPA: hypothetical protein PLE27_11690 [Bacteroidia bacterium]|nr:hypothetical protein [Bacteroidia bacterium]
MLTDKIIEINKKDGTGLQKINLAPVVNLMCECDLPMRLRQIKDFMVEGFNPEFSGELGELQSHYALLSRMEQMFELMTQLD